MSMALSRETGGAYSSCNPPKKIIQGMLSAEQGASLLLPYLWKQVARFAATMLRLPVTVYLCRILHHH